MRKPYLFGAGAAVLLLALASYQFASPSQAESPRLERYLPSDTIGFVEVSDLRAQALRVIESEAWREFSKENQAASSLFMITANHAGALDASYAVALVGVEADASGKPQPQFLAIAEFEGKGARRTFENRILRLTKKAGEKGTTTSTEDYNGVTINLVSPEGRDGFAYAQTDNTLYLSNTAAAVRRAVDVRAGKAASLETVEPFLQARAQAKYSDGMFGFLDGVALTRLIDSVPEGEGQKGIAAFKQFFHGVGVDSVRSVAFTSTFEDGRVAERFAVVAPDKGGVLASLASNPPTQQTLVALVPADAIQVFNASIANAPQAFDQVLALAAQLGAQAGRNKPAEGLAEFASKTGVDFRSEIVGALGSEVCVAQLPDGDKRFGVVILNVKDTAGFDATLRRLAAHKQGSVSEREHRGVKVMRVAGEKGHGFEYAVIGNNFVISGEGRGVERVIETSQGGESLKSSARYSSASAEASGAQFVYFNSNADYLGRLGRMLKSSGKDFKTETASAALRPSFAYGVARAEGFFIESRTPLGTFPRLLTAAASKLGDAGETESSE